MSVIGVATDLASIEAGIVRAVEIAVNADTNAAEISDRSATTGFVGIAQTMRRVRQAIVEVRGRIASLSDSVSAVRASVSAVPEQTTPQQAVVAFTSVLAAVDEARRLGTAHRPAGDIDPEPVAPAIPEVLPPPPRFDPVKAGEIRPYCGHPKAIGRLYRAGDDHPAGDLLFSGVKGPGAGGPGLIPPWLHYESLTDHTEGHAAAIMRDQQIRDGVLYLNMHPCMKPAGCHLNIAKAMPTGYRLTVWVVNADGSRVRRIYRGNGEGTAP